MIACAGIIAAVGIVAYANSLDGAFVFDDHTHIVGNDDIRSLTPLSNHLGARRPLVSLSLAVNYAIGGDNPRSYHVFNILIHVLAGLVLFGVIRRTAELVRSEQAGDASNTLIAAAAALLWVAHPIQTQSVTYVIQRGESMMGLFYLLTLYCVIRGAKKSDGTAWFIAAVIFCALGMASKAVMVTAPVMILLYDRTFLSSSLADAIRRRWVLYLGLAATWGVLAATGVVEGVLSTNAGRRATVGFSYKDVTPLHYLFTQPSVILFYIRQAVLPIDLCLDYGWTTVRSFSAAALPGLVILIILLAAAWGCWKRRWWGFAGMWFFLILAPTSSFIPIRDIAFIHRMYLSLAALTVLAAAGVWYLGGRLASRAHMGRVFACIGLLVPLVGAQLVGTWARNRVFASEAAVWRDVVAKRPAHARAWVNLGEALDAREQSEEVIACCQRALSLNPNNHVKCAAYVNLGSAYAIQQRYKDAADAFRKAIETGDSNEWPVFFNLGGALFRMGEMEEALAAYRTVIEKDPGNANAKARAARCLVALGQHAEAVELWRQSLEKSSGDVETWYNMGNALSHLGRVSEAAEAYRKALAIQPSLADARCNLGHMLLRLGRTSEALSEFQRVLRQSPRHVPASFNLGLALNQLGRREEAIRAFQRVLEIDPNHAQAAAALAELQAGGG